MALLKRLQNVHLNIFHLFAGNSNFVSGYETFEPEIPRSDSDSTEIHHPGEKSQIRIDVAQATQEESDFSAAFVNHDGDDDDDDDISEIEADILKKSLPSMQLRRVKSLARPGLCILIRFTHAYFVEYLERIKSISQ